MIKHNIPKKVLHIGDTVETLEINDNVRIVLSIEDEIIQAEETQWLKEVFAEIRAGEKDIALISNYPVARTKFYDVKNEFINKNTTFVSLNGLSLTKIYQKSLLINALVNSLKHNAASRTLKQSAAGCFNEDFLEQKYTYFLRFQMPLQTLASRGF